MTATDSLSQEEPVRFRVESFGPNMTINRMMPAEPMIVSFRFRDGAGRIIGVTPGQIAPYEESLRDAVDSRVTYWVEALDSDLPTSTLKRHDTILYRLLNAVRDRQIVQGPIAE